MTRLYALQVVHDFTQGYNIAGAIVVEVGLADDETRRIVTRHLHVPVTTNTPRSTEMV